MGCVRVCACVRERARTCMCAGVVLGGGNILFLDLNADYMGGLLC